MQEALAEARLAAEEGEVPVGAVLVSQGKLVARAHNRREQMQDPTQHAEMQCLRDASSVLKNWRLKDCTLYVTLEPCPMCAGAMVMSRLSRCVYGAADARYGCCGSVYDLPADPKLESTCSWQSGLLEQECAALLQGFFQQKR